MRSHANARMSAMDRDLSGDPVLSQVVNLFAEPMASAVLVEHPRQRIRTRRLPQLRRVVSRPTFLLVSGTVMLVVCTPFGGLLNSGAIALAGLAGPILLGIGWLIITRHRFDGRRATARRTTDQR